MVSQSQVEKLEKAKQRGTPRPFLLLLYWPQDPIMWSILLSQREETCWEWPGDHCLTKCHRVSYIRYDTVDFPKSREMSLPWKQEQPLTTQSRWSRLPAAPCKIILECPSCPSSGHQFQAWLNADPSSVVDPSAYSVSASLDATSGSLLSPLGDVFLSAHYKLGFAYTWWLSYLEY